MNHNYSYIRVLHASPNAPNVDIYVNNMLVAWNLAFKNLTQYLPVDPGNYTIQIFPTDEQTPVLTENIQVLPQSILTLAATGEVCDLSLLTIPDPDDFPMKDAASIRVVHLSPNAPAVDIKINGQTLSGNVQYEEVTEYELISAATYDLEVYVAKTNNLVLTIPNLVLRSVFFNTIYILGLVGEEPPLQTITTLDGLYDFVPLQDVFCPEGFIYIVQPGDTLFSIANKFGVTVEEILAANPQIEDPNLIFPGDQICIPDEEPPYPCQCRTIYTVQPGDSLYTIAQQFNVTVDRLLQCNPQITNPNLIYPGQRICIPYAESPYPCQCRTIYTVQPGDSLYTIAQQFNVSLNRLILCNPQITNPNVIYPGQRICIPA